MKIRVWVRKDRNFPPTLHTHTHMHVCTHTSAPKGISYGTSHGCDSISLLKSVMFLSNSEKISEAIRDVNRHDNCAAQGTVLILLFSEIRFLLSQAQVQCFLSKAISHTVYYSNHLQYCHPMNTNHSGREFSVLCGVTAFHPS